MIEFRNVYKNYGKNQAVTDLSFKVEDGEILGFLGPNGAGKSTSLNILTGCLSASGGEALIDGYDILEHPMEAKKRIGYLPEHPPLYLDMTVNEYLNFVYRLKKCSLSKEQHFNDICDVVRISDVRKRLIKNLSKGYRQRVGIAQTLIGNPGVLVFDEPTVGLDPKQIIEIRNLIKTLGKEHTIILSTHILSEVQQICDRIVVINEGKLIANEKTEDLANAIEGSRKQIVKIVGNREDVEKALRGVNGVRSVEVIGKRDGDSISYLLESEDKVDIRKPLFFAMSENNWPIIGIEGTETSLEDIFMKLIEKRNFNDEKKKKSRGMNKLGEIR